MEGVGRQYFGRNQFVEKLNRRTSYVGNIVYDWQMRGEQFHGSKTLCVGHESGWKERSVMSVSCDKCYVWVKEI